MTGQEAGDLEGAGVLEFNPKGKGFQAPVEQEAGVGIHRSAEGVELEQGLFDEVRAADDRAADDIRMAV
jgi:hypothetical protein